jgi:hypothetical protein
MKNGLFLIVITLFVVLFGCRNKTQVNSPEQSEFAPSLKLNYENVSEIDKEYEFLGKTDLIVDGRNFTLESIPNNIFEEIVVREYFYTITAEFDKKHEVLANIEPHSISVENEKRNFAEGIFIKSYVIHGITTLTVEQYNDETNQLNYWGWQRVVNEFGLIDFRIVNVDFSVIFSNGGIQWSDGTYNRSFIVGRNNQDITYKIYDFGFM